jgi:DNA-binding MarR family transcriptional regulator
LKEAKNRNLRWRVLAEQQPQFTKTDLRLVDALANRMNALGFTHPGRFGVTVEDLARATRSSRSSVQASLRKLEDEQWLVMQRAVGRGRKNVYGVMFPEGGEIRDIAREQKERAAREEAREESAVAVWMKCVQLFKSSPDAPPESAPAAAVAILEEFGGWGKVARMDTISRNQEVFDHFVAVFGDSVPGRQLGG